jgi:hypothetical protein
MRKIIIAISLIFVFCASTYVSKQYSTEATYTIQVFNGTYWAKPLDRSNLPTFKNTDIGALVNSVIGVIGDSGSIHITTGKYTQTTTIVIAGNGSLPYNQLTIYGDGLSTNITENASNVSNFKIINNASVNLHDMQMFSGNLGGPNILADTTGSGSECSMQRSQMTNLFLNNASTTLPAAWFKDFFTLTSTNCTIVSNSNSAVILENHSHNGTYYGNSVFRMLTTAASSSYPNAGLIARSTDGGATLLDHIVFENYYCYSGYIGASLGDCEDFQFNLFDIENPVHDPIVLAANFPNVTTYFGCLGNKFSGGALLAPSSDTNIIAHSKSGGNKFDGVNILFQGNLPADTTTILIMDSCLSYNMPNSYDINIFYPGKPNVFFNSPANTWFSFRSWTGQAVAEFNY